MPPQPLVEAIPTPELKVVCNVVTPFFPTWIEDTFSVYHKLLHVNAWCRRFIANLKSTINHLPRTNSPHLITEVESSEKHLFRLAQQRAFATKLINLNQGQLVSSSSSIKSLSPFMDKDGLIRVGGRLAQSHLRSIRSSSPARVGLSISCSTLNMSLWAIVAQALFCQLQVPECMCSGQRDYPGLSTEDVSSAERPMPRPDRR